MLTAPLANPGEGTLGRSGYPPDQCEAIKIPVRVGDEILGGETPSVIKIDVEGYELFVLKGLASTIERTKPAILTEVIDRHLSNAGTGIKELAAFMTKMDYKPYRIALEGRHRLRATPEVLAPGTDGDFVWLPPAIRADKSTISALGIGSS